MINKRFLSMLVLLAALVTGTWAESTPQIVNQDNIDDIFSGEGYTLGDAVKAGDILDFQGTIDIQHRLVINKQVDITSTTKDAVVKLNSLLGDGAGKEPDNSFVINKAGSGTTVSDIRLENTQTWLYNTSYVTFTNVTMWVDNASIGKGVGHVAIRYSDHVTFDGCTVYTKDNGGSAGCVLTGSHDCIFKDSRFETAGNNVANVLYIANPYNIADKPADYTLNNDNISVLNCTITGETSGGISNFKIMNGLGHRIENCTVNFTISIGTAATTSDDGYIIRNNTFTKGVTVPKFATAEGNTVTGNVTVNQEATATNNTITGDVTLSGNNAVFTGNQVVGKVKTSSKANTITGNTIISTAAYAVSLTSTAADANNTVQDNVLMAVGSAGDAAVESKSTANTISANKSHATTADGLSWTYDASMNTLTIGGTGAMADYSKTTDGQHSTAPWAFLDDKAERVVIGENVTAIGQNAFYGFTGVTSVVANGTTPPSLGTDAFDFQATVSINVPAGTAAAYQTAWSTYASAISEYMPCGAVGHETDVLALYDAATKTLTIAGTGAMADYASASDQPWKALDIKTVVIENTVTAVGQNAFAYCAALSAVYVEGASLTAGTGAFDGNAEGRKIIVPLANAKAYAESWTDYAADIRAIGNCGVAGHETDIAWEYAPSAQSLTITGTGAMADYASSSSMPWYSVRTAITSVTIGEGVTNVGNYAFYGSSNLATVSIPSSVTSIGNSAFYGCSKLATVSIPSSVTAIGNYAFQRCSSLEAVSIPSSVTAIGTSAFSGCSKLAEVYIFAPSLNTYGNNAFINNANGRKIYVPASSLETYQAGWPGYATDIVAMINLTANEGDTGEYWATYYDSSVGYIADANTTVYQAAVNGDKTKVVLTEVTGREIPAGNAVVLKSTSDAITLTPATTTQTLTGNELLGTDVDLSTPSNAYCLSRETTRDGGLTPRGIGFYTYTLTTIPAHKSYLVVEGGPATSRGFLGFGEDDNTTAIQAHKAISDDADGTIYDLSGRRIMGQPQKGIYVKNGKKFVIK